MAALNPDACEFKPIQVVASPFSPLFNAPKPTPPSFDFVPLHYFPTSATGYSLEEELPMYPNIYNNFYIYVTPSWQNPTAKTSFYSDFEDLHPSYEELLSQPPLSTPSVPHQREEEKTEAGGDTEGVIPTFRNCSRIGFLCRRRRGRRTGEGHAKTWVRKIASDEVIESGDGVKTTLMIRNIPVKYTCEMLVEFLDDHCLQENEKLSKDGGVDHLGSASAYDFVYLPMDFSCGRNKGYAFVNFTNSSGADRLRSFLHGYKWGILSSNKVCEITDARIQGRKALEIHFEGSIFVCQMQSYLPIVFEPYRNGLCSFISRNVGRFLHRRRRN